MHLKNRRQEGEGNGSDKVNLSSGIVLDSLKNHVAMIRFDLQRKVVDVNDLFAKTMKYRKEEMIGMYHHLFCPPSFVNSNEYKEFGRSCSSD